MGDGGGLEYRLRRQGGREVAIDFRGKSGQIHVVKSWPGGAAVAVRCMNRQRFCWILPVPLGEHGLQQRSDGGGSCGQLRLEPGDHLSALAPWICPSIAIFRQIALVASADAWSASAPRMMGSMASMAVWGRPLARASSTCFQAAPRAGVQW